MRSAGFTIIELVVVIILLGVLAAVALPRFIEVSDEAHTAQVEAVAGAFATGVQTARAVWQLNGEGGPAENLQVFGAGQEGQIDFNASGWPSQQWFGGIEANPQLNNVADCISVINALLQTSTVIDQSADRDYTPTYLGSGRCRYTYVPTAGLSFEYDSNTGEVTRNF